MYTVPGIKESCEKGKFGVISMVTGCINQHICVKCETRELHDFRGADMLLHLN